MPHRMQNTVIARRTKQKSYFVREKLEVIAGVQEGRSLARISHDNSLPGSTIHG